MTDEIGILDLDTHEPTDEQIISWHEMMTAPDQLAWEYDPAWAEEDLDRQEVIRSFRENRAKRRGQNHPLWAMAGGRVVGMIGINRFTGTMRGHCAELGFGVAAEFSRRGIGTRLMTAAIAKSRALGLMRLEADCFAENAACVALLLKCGFREEGLRRGAILRDGVLRDQRLFGLML